MRLSLGVLVCLGLSGLCAAWADEPTKASPEAATPALVTAPSPAAAPTAAAAPVAAVPAASPVKTVDADQERYFRALGYTPKMHDGEKLWCRHEEVLGSRVSGKQVCSTPEQLRQAEQQSKSTLESIQRSSMTGCPKPCR